MGATHAVALRQQQMYREELREMTQRVDAQLNTAVTSCDVFRCGVPDGSAEKIQEARRGDAGRECQPNPF